jgi:hypothetical protein
MCQSTSREEVEMPAKEQARSTDKTMARRRSAQPTVPDFDMLAQQTHLAAIVQRARLNPHSLTPRDVLQLQGTIGNQTVVKAGIIQRMKARTYTQYTGENRANIRVNHLQDPDGQPLEDQTYSTVSGRSATPLERYYQGLVRDAAYNDAEIKLVSRLANILFYRYKDKWKNVTGHATLWSDQGPCTPCRHAIKMLKKDVQGLAITVQYRDTYKTRLVSRKGKNVQYGYDDATGEAGNWVKTL